MTGPDISDLVLAIIERLGLEGDDVRALSLDATRPEEIVVTRYRRDGAGRKYFDENGEPALETSTIAAISRARGAIPKVQSR